MLTFTYSSLRKQGYLPQVAQNRCINYCMILCCVTCTQVAYRKIPKISPGAYFWTGLSTEGNLRFKIDWASLIFGRKFTVFALYSRAISRYIPPPPWGDYIRRGDLTEVFLRYEFGGPIFGGAYT